MLFASRDKASRLLEKSYDALRAGDKVTALDLLDKVLEVDDRNEKAWYYRAWTVDTEDERRQCLETVLDINPSNAQARRLLNELIVRQLESQIGHLREERNRQQRLAQQKALEASGWEHRQNELAEALPALQDKRAGLGRQVAALEDQKEELNRSVTELADRVAELQEQCKQLSDEFEQKNQALSDRLEQESSLRDQVSQLEEALQDLATTKEEQEREITALQRQAAEWQERLKTAQNDVYAEQSSLATLRQEQERLCGEVRRRRELVVGLESAQANLERELAESESLVAVPATQQLPKSPGVESRLPALVLGEPPEVTDISAESDDRADPVVQAQADLNTLRQEVKAQEDRLAELRRQAEHLEEEIRRRESTLAGWFREI
jgi:chromosome segregation ATPase